MTYQKELELFELHSNGERVTPIEEIPIDLRLPTRLPCGRKQIIDARRCYTFHPEYADAIYPDGAYLECINLAVDELD